MREGVKVHRENPFTDGSLGYYRYSAMVRAVEPRSGLWLPPPVDIDALVDGHGIVERVCSKGSF
jgi:hypothetical protein